MLEEAEPDAEACLTFLHDSEHPPDDELPNTGVELDMERMLSPLFIASGRYGTRASSVILLSEDRGRFIERTYFAGGVEGGTEDVEF